MEQTQSPMGLVCPNCRVDLVMSERQRVEIDYCPKCRGVWLDRGELDTIIERALAEARATTAPTPAAAPAASFLPPNPAQAVWPGQPAQPQTGYEPSRDYRRDDHGHHDDDHDNSRKRRREGFFDRFFD